MHTLWIQVNSPHPGKNGHDDIFKCILRMKSLYFDQLDFTEVCFQGSNW